MWLVSENGHACPQCGWTPPPKAKEIPVQDADLVELADQEGAATPHDRHVIEFDRQACTWYGRRWPERWRERPTKGRWWAWLQTQAKFRIGEAVKMPGSYWEAAPLPISAEVSGWLQHRVIKFARSKARAAGGLQH